MSSYGACVEPWLMKDTSVLIWKPESTTLRNVFDAMDLEYRDTGTYLEERSEPADFYLTRILGGTLGGSAIPRM